MKIFRLPRPGINLFQKDKILFLLWAFILVFPKAGIKIGEIPLTWGYLFLGISSIVAFITRKEHKVQEGRILLLLCLLPFQVISAFTIFLNGIENLGMTFSFFVSFFFIPFVFLFVFSNDIETLDLDRFSTLCKKGIFFVTCYGIFLFLFKQITGRFIEIPLLTMNLGDVGELENKHINRGGVFKLISTYNNGNIFGVCLLMLLPLYSCLEKTKWRVHLLKLALLLTLSRTVWFGLVFHEIFVFLNGLKQRGKKWPQTLLTWTLIGLSLGAFSYFYGFTKAFIFDSNLGGRNEQLNVLGDLSFICTKPFSGLFEMVYLAILDSFGIFGLLAYLLGMFSPLFFSLKTSDPLKTALKLGIFNYLLVSISDGALLLIPVMALFWFLASFLVRKSFSSVIFVQTNHNTP